MNRRLVLTSEGARHPFRQTLPPHVLRAMPQPEPEVLQAIADQQALEALQIDLAHEEQPLFAWRTGILELPVPACEDALIEPAPVAEPVATPAAQRSRWGFSTGDLRDFLLTYCACFVAVSAFIS